MAQSQLPAANSIGQSRLYFAGNVVLPDVILQDGIVAVSGPKIESVGPVSNVSPSPGVQWITSGHGYIVPGFVDLHVHGGSGADFMDGTDVAFQTVIRSHARHGTTSIVPTSTVARDDQIVRFLEVTRDFRSQRPDCARVLGAHFYGPYFGPESRGCHPAAPLRSPVPDEYRRYLKFADSIVTATIAPELAGAEQFVRDCTEQGIRINAGHSHATFDQMATAIGWGVRHVDHLFCAMSDRARLRQTQPYPMRGGVLEATMYFDQLTTEVIADGRHLARELLQLAFKLKGPDRLALVTDCNRALDMPEGRYIFGPVDGGEPFLHRDGVGVMPDGQSLASGATGMDHAVRTFHRLTGVSLPEVVRMASLTPARIIGWDDRIGSLEAGKLADVLVLDPELNLKRVFVEGREVPVE